MKFPSKLVVSNKPGFFKVCDGKLFAVKIYLIGFMASGKTWLGIRLAKELGFSFIDLDANIEQQSGKTIGELFDEFGESGFRKLEREELLRTKTEKNCVIATGGGTPCFFDNMDWMNENGITVFINPPLKIIKERLNGSGTRPLVKGMKEEELEAFIVSKMAERQTYYNRSHLCLEPLNDSEKHLQVLADYLKRFLR